MAFVLLSVAFVVLCVGMAIQVVATDRRAATERLVELVGRQRALVERYVRQTLLGQDTAATWAFLEATNSFLLEGTDAVTEGGEAIEARVDAIRGVEREEALRLEERLETLHEYVISRGRSLQPQEMTELTRLGARASETADGLTEALRIRSERRWRQATFLDWSLFGVAVLLTAAAITVLRRQRRSLLTAQAVAVARADLLEAAADGMVVVEADTMAISYANRGASAQTGRSQKELLGTTLDDLDLRHDADQLRLFLDRASSSQRAVSFETQIGTAAGGRLAVEIKLQQVRGLSGPDDRFLAVMRDMTSSRELDRFHRTFEAAPVGLAHVSPAGRWLRANKALCAMLGYEEQALRGLSTQELTLPEDLQDDLDQIHDVLQGFSDEYRTEKHYVRRDGVSIPCRQTVSVVRQENGAPDYLIAVIEEISAEQEAMREQLELTRELARSNAELQRFAYVASHDLQEPLRSVGGFVQLLERRSGDALDEKSRHYIRRAVAGVERMRRLINDLLIYSRAQRKTLHLEEIDVGGLLDEVVAGLNASLVERGGRIEWDDLPPVQADSLGLSQVFQNLLANGIKFAREGVPPEIRITARQNSRETVFSVHDNGIGIEEAATERIFGLFQRLHGRDEHPGTGLGLAICRQVVERHGGHIWVESTEGGGSTFHFSLPHGKRADDE